MALRRLSVPEEKDACGVGFVATRRPEPARMPLLKALGALDCIEHRGAVLSDRSTGDGTGIMTDIPFALLGHDPGSIGLASLMLLGGAKERTRALSVVQHTFSVMGIETLARRTVPTDPRVLGPQAVSVLPELLQVVFGWPPWCRTEASFNQLLYLAKQKSRTQLRKEGLYGVVSFASLSASTVVYKALVRSHDLASFYPDLVNSAFRTRFALFHRRFSTNTRTSWDKAQPFRLIAHNGEINTIAGNRSWCYSREQALGLPKNELLTHVGVSDSGNLNEMVEALKFRSSIPYVEDALAIMIPPADVDNNYYRFWSRAAEPWDGPALITYCDGQAIGARADRNGFRPCRWAMTEDAFYLASEAGVFDLDDQDVIKKGTLRAGSGVKVVLGKSDVLFRDPSHSAINKSGELDPRLSPLTPEREPGPPMLLDKKQLFGVGSEEYDKLLLPMIQTGKEPIGSMGDTSALALLSEDRRSFFDFFFQTFAQVTNPPLDYLRESLVTNLSVYLGRSPNIFIPKELIPPREGLFLDSPVLTLDQLAAVRAYSQDRRRGPAHDEGETPALCAAEIDICFDRARGPAGMRHALDRIAERALALVQEGVTILILSDLGASPERPPIPSLLALRAVNQHLNKWGQRLRTSVVVATGDARTTHHVACLVGFGAHAVCPVLAFEVARHATDPGLAALPPDEREANLKRALEGGLLKIMSKMGISVVRSYMSAKLFSAVGLGDDIIDTYFRGLTSPVGGLGLEEVAQLILDDTAQLDDDDHPRRTFLLKEHNKGEHGPRHSMTAARARLVHDAVMSDDPATSSTDPRWATYVHEGEKGPVTLRHLLEPIAPDEGLMLDEVEPAEKILPRFSSGSMSFGAISAKSQRDIIKAMRAVGGRAGSGEGGENPYYFVDGTTATVKQVASGRFGVTAEYLVGGDEFEIKIAQGAKPGEGGQLMGIKVDDQIAKARFALPGVDLISPPPLHDIYSIEDLKQLIYELRQLKPDAKVCVKLVSGTNIGTIAVGVVKAGADAILVSGGDGGTGAATISSMRHAGLPWELGLSEVHHTLCENDLRDHVELRVDGGLSTGEDVVVAAILGAQGFGFGKLLLVAEGCIMARVCEKNTCPRGIATHDPRFLAKYRGDQTHVERLLRLIADDVRHHLARLSVRSLHALVGRTDLLHVRPSARRLVRARGIDLSGLLRTSGPLHKPRATAFPTGVSPLNQAVLDEAAPVLDGAQDTVTFSRAIRPTDRAALARLSGAMATEVARRRRAAREAGQASDARRGFDFPDDTVRVRFDGSAGQGFAVFLTAGVSVELFGEANDAVAKGMSGGRVVVRPSPRFAAPPEDNVIIGNCALYGATGGTLFVHGRAGDRFGVRNSGADAVVEGVGLHACEYMTGGRVVVLGAVSHNVGAGMTGGEVFVRRDMQDRVNREYLACDPLDPAAEASLRALLTAYAAATQSATAQAWLADKDLSAHFVWGRPRGTPRAGRKAA